MQPIQFKNSGYVKPEQHPTIAKSFTPAESAATPKSFVVDIAPFKEVQNVFMQAQEPSCVAHGVTWAIMYHYWKKTGKFVKLSPRFVYAMCKTVDKLPVDAGTYLSVALQIVKDHGVCEDSFFPNDTSLDVATYTNASLISAEAKANALKYRIDNFSFLKDLAPSTINTAIYNGGKGDVVMIGMDVSDWWWTGPDGNSTWSADSLLPLRPIDATHPQISGHCVDLYAFGEEWDSAHPTNWYGMNWWSPEWAYQGRFCIGANDLPNIYQAATMTAEFANTTPAPSVPETTHDLTFVEKVEEIIEEVVEEIKSII